MAIPHLLTEGPYTGQWYRCGWCRKRRAVGHVHHCPVNPNLNTGAPWGPACEPDQDGIQR